MGLITARKNEMSSGSTNTKEPLHCSHTQEDCRTSGLLSIYNNGLGRGGDIMVCTIL